MMDNNYDNEIDNDFDEFDTEFDVYSNEVDNKVWTTLFFEQHEKNINELLEGIDLD